LAGQLEWDFLDTDDKIVEDQGKSIREIVENQGWEAFRKMERDVIKSFSGNRSYVIATGGGVILDEENVKVMKRTGSVVWLKASAQTIQQRLSKDKITQAYRPSLTQKGTFDEVRETLKKRAPYYKSAMNYGVETDEATVEDVCREILKRIR